MVATRATALSRLALCAKAIWVLDAADAGRLKATHCARRAIVHYHYPRYG
jgi:ABC-type transport system involved in cytochrome c biogenesis ATPase subunit